MSSAKKTRAHRRGACSPRSTLQNAVSILQEELLCSSSEYIGVEQHLPLERFVADLLQRQRRSGDVLGKALFALRIREAD